MNNNNKAILLALLAVLLWSSVATIFKLTLRYFSPSVMLFYSIVFSILSIFTVLVFQKKIHLIFSYNKKEYFALALLGFINPTLYYLVLFRAYDILPAQEAQPINYTWALMLTYLSVFILKRKIGVYDFLAGIICYFGVFIISTHGNLSDFEFTSSKGVFLAVFSTFLWSIYWVYSTKLSVEPVVGLFINFLFGFLFVSVYFIVFGYHLTFDIYGLMGSFYIGMFEMGLTFILWLFAMKLTSSSSKVANLIFLSPFLSLIFIHFVLKEDIRTSTFVGLSMIIFGLILQQKKGKVNKT